MATGTGSDSAFELNRHPGALFKKNSSALRAIFAPHIVVSDRASSVNATDSLHFILTANIRNRDGVVVDVANEIVRTTG